MRPLLILRRKPPVLLLALGLATAAHAGVVVTSVQKDLADPKQSFTFKLYVDKGKARMETSISPDNSYIYRADKSVIWLVDGRAKTYTEVTEKDIEAMANTMKMMQEQMANLPPEQRAMMEKMMPGIGSAPKMTFKKGATGKAGNFACTNYEMFRDGKKFAEACYADPKMIGFAEEDFKTLRSLAKPVEKFAKDFAALFPQPEVAGAPEGVPVKTIVFQEGRPQSETVVQEVKKESLEGSLYDLPKGYAKQALQMPGAGG
jgi:hypothetical protein